MEGFVQKASGVKDYCKEVEEDALMKRLHRNAWSTGSNRINDAANPVTKLIGKQIMRDTDKAQQRLMGQAKSLALGLKK